MRLALVRQRYTPYGGAERFMDRALTALREAGSEVVVIARDWPDNTDGRHLRRCDPFYIGRTWRDAGFARAVRRIIAGREFDLVQSHERIPGCQIYRAGDGVHATWLELRDRILPLPQRIATRMQPWHRYTLAAEAAMFRDPALRAVICNSHMVKDDIGRRFGLPEAKLHVVPNGVDLNHFNPETCALQRDRVRAELNIPATGPVVLFVGSGFQRKGLPQLLHAFARLPRRDTRLIVVGRDRKEQAMRRHANWLGIAAQVHFVGQQQDVRPYYGAADVFALPTLYDPFPNAALEAMACGLPVLTSTASGAKELIADGSNGFVVDALDVAALAANIEAALATASDMGAAARRSAETMPIAGTAQTLSSLYRSVLQGSL